MMYPSKIATTLTGYKLEQDAQVKIRDFTKIGDILSGEVTGTVDFGIFVKLEDGLEGLVHISEIDWSHLKDVESVLKVGDKIEVKLIEVDKKTGKLKLSRKVLLPRPPKPE